MGHGVESRFEKDIIFSIFLNGPCAILHLFGAFGWFVLGKNTENYVGGISWDCPVLSGFWFFDRKYYSGSWSIGCFVFDHIV